MMNISYDWRPPYQSCKLVIRPHQLIKVFIHNLFPCWQFLLQRNLSSLWTKPRTRRRSFNVEPRVPRTAGQWSSTLSLGVSWPLTPSCWSCCRAPRWSCRLWEARPTWVATPWATSTDWRGGGNSHSQTVNINSLRVLQANHRLRPLHSRGLCWGRLQRHLREGQQLLQQLWGLKNINIIYPTIQLSRVKNIYYLSEK